MQEEIIKLENELHDLKTIQGAIKTARAYTYSGTFGQAGARITLEITYANGDIPIILSWSDSAYITPLKISGNKQKIFMSIYGGQKITFSATREIKSVVRL